MNFYKQIVIALASISLIYIAAFAYFLNDSSEFSFDQAVEEVPYLHQERLFMTKHYLFTNEEGQRLQLCVRSKESLLTFEEGAFQEKMQGVKGLLQEKLYTLHSIPMQIGHYFEAESAHFYHRKGMVAANRAKMMKWRALGHHYQEHLSLKKVLMQGKCEQINLFLFDKPFHFQAQNFHATLHGEKI